MIKTKHLVLSVEMPTVDPVNNRDSDCVRGRDCVGKRDSDLRSVLLENVFNSCFKH